MKSIKFGKVLERELESREWTLSRLAKETGISKSTLHSWSTGRSAINLEKLKKLAMTLEISVHQLIFDEPDPYATSAKEILTEIFSGDVRVTLQKIERK